MIKIIFVIFEMLFIPKIAQKNNKLLVNSALNNFKTIKIEYKLYLLINW